jgi:hypothetical protein
MTNRIGVPHASSSRQRPAVGYPSLPHTAEIAASRVFVAGRGIASIIGVTLAIGDAS